MTEETRNAIIEELENLLERMRRVYPEQHAEIVRDRLDKLYKEIK